MTRIAVAVFMLTMAGAPAMADTILLPDVSVHLLAAHYAPVDTDFRWVGWIGAGAGPSTEMPSASGTSFPSCRANCSVDGPSLPETMIPASRPWGGRPAFSRIFFSCSR